MATGFVITVAEKLFTLLTSEEFKDICSMFEYESRLNELADTVSAIKVVLLDAELKHQELTHRGREFIEKLNDAVYDVDYVMNEFNTMFQKEKGENNGKTLEKVRRFFSRSNQILVAHNMSHEVKNLREKLDSVAKNRQQFDFSDVFEPPKKRKEIGSYAREDGIIGRKADTEAIIFAKMTGKNVGFGMEQLQREVRNMIEGRKYLLVPDDVWDENHNKWVELKDFLKLGGNGSRVLTTSRSKAVARAIENNHMYLLQGLSDEYSWRLFERMAFEQGKTPIDDDLVDIGKDVVKKCTNVPLSIRVVGSLLYGEHKSKWLSFKSIDLRKLESNKDSQAKNGIMPILKYSYYHLSPSLKSCFSYCALFPKDFEIMKTQLIWLWMAYGYLDVADDGRSIEEVDDDYFLILANRCFIQDTKLSIIQFLHKEGTYGKIYSCKMYDLIHDLALEVAGKEMLGLETSVFQFNQKIRHLSMGNDGWKLLSSDGRCLGELKKLRSLHYNSHRRSKLVAANESNLNKLCSNFRRLRVLDFTVFGLKSLPNTLEILPESITKLQNLLVLNLSFCELRELPKGLRNLHNLRHLDLTHCSTLTHMPEGIDSMQVKTGQLKDLRSLINLKGRLEIIFRRGFSYDLANASEVDLLLSNKVHLNELVVGWEKDACDEHNQGAIHETLLESLRPHCNIEGIEIRGNKGVKIPSWVGSLAVFFPCLVTVSLHYFDWLYNLPSLSQHLHLKVLKL
ncbi:hypothetical protein RND81_14G187300 [Saponaria officinalis]|uniref:Uncharacterized protein n=1 Tax=Saponaria officinalis TaxID=3572 RepID=A0AAW1GTW9_SAPOF